MKLKTRSPGEELTGNKTFDRQCDVLCPGNVHADTQFSAYIRPHNEVECNGKTFKPGELQAFDLKPFLQIGCPSYVLRIVRQENEKHGKICLYQFRHWRRNPDTGKREQIIHGWIITDYNNRFLISIPANYRQKSMMVLARLRPYISHS